MITYYADFILARSAADVIARTINGSVFFSVLIHD